VVAIASECGLPGTSCNTCWAWAVPKEMAVDVIDKNIIDFHADLI
jgi:hypothetical protein